MARGRLFDYLQDSYFWAFDATSELAVPVFNPLFGFSRISSPTITAQVETFKDGTYLYPRHVIKGAEVGSILFERAASMFDADFYDWITFAVHGDKGFESGGTLGKIVGAIQPKTFRRTILVVQFNRINLSKLSDDPFAPVLLTAAAAFQGAITGGAAGAAAGAVGGTIAGVGAFKIANRLPGRAWVLHNCIPVNYRASSDFDASSGQISLQELEVQPEYVEELSLGLKP